MKLTVNRIDQDKNRTLSECAITDNQGRTLLTFKGIELPWVNNERGKSCIPTGTYKAVAVRRASNAAYALHVLNVPNRAEIMVHTTNFARDLRGCLAPGTNFADIDRDGITDVTNSRAVMKQIEKIIPLGMVVEYSVKQ